MLKNILIAEDHQSINISVQKTLSDLGATNVAHVYYCDDALKMIRKSPFGEPFNLLITDIYFDDDSNKQAIPDGIELIKAAKQILPELKVLAFSAEGRPMVIERLFNQLNIDGYVRKARNDSQELKIALESIFKGRRHFASHLRNAIKQTNSYDFSELDITIISLLSCGMRQKDIPVYLQQNNFKPSGLSSVEKRLTRIKEVLEFSNNEQLVAFCKDMGLI
ncbi:response regulator [Arcticibacter sp.]|jgi:DNA-binding NarL/FixJ family response regulator|uniref:response regulator n=1 Tax=Arcticibacter sp. TaxID=1872630 RepID=UPI00388F6F00